MRVFSVNQSENRPSFGKIIIERDGVLEIQKLANASLDLLQVSKPEKFSSSMVRPGTKEQVLLVQLREFLENINFLKKNPKDESVPEWLRNFYDFFVIKHNEIPVEIKSEVKDGKGFVKIVVRDKEKNTNDVFPITNEGFQAACEDVLKDVKELRKRYFANKEIYNNWDNEILKLKFAAAFDFDSEFFNKINHTVS